MTQEILTKANETVKNANFTYLKKIRKNSIPCFLIVNTANFGIYGDFFSDLYFAIDNSGNIFQLA